MKTIRNYLDERSDELLESDYIDWAISFCEEFGYITTDDLSVHYGIENLSQEDIKNINKLPFFYNGFRNYKPEIKRKNDGSLEQFYSIVLEEGYYSIHKVTKEKEVKYFFTTSIKEYTKKERKIMKLEINV